MKSILAVFLLTAIAAQGAEGFGAKKKVVSIERTIPPAISGRNSGPR